MKSQIEAEKKDQDADISKIKMQLDVQKQMIVNQRNLLNNLKVHSENYQSSMTRASTDLAKLNAYKE